MSAGGTLAMPAYRRRDTAWVARGEFDLQRAWAIIRISQPSGSPHDGSRSTATLLASGRDCRRVEGRADFGAAARCADRALARGGQADGSPRSMRSPRDPAFARVGRKRQSGLQISWLELRLR